VCFTSTLEDQILRSKARRQLDPKTPEYRRPKPGAVPKLRNTHVLGPGICHLNNPKGAGLLFAGQSLPSLLWRRNIASWYIALPWSCFHCFFALHPKALRQTRPSNVSGATTATNFLSVASRDNDDDNGRSPPLKSGSLRRYTSAATLHAVLLSAGAIPFLHCFPHSLGNCHV